MKKGLLFFLFIAGSIVSAQAQKDTTYKSFLGVYTFPVGSVIPSLEVAGDSLNALNISSEAGSSPLEYQGNDKFGITNFNGTAEFKRSDSTKQVIAIHVEAMGYILDGTRENGNKAFTWSVTYFDDRVYATNKCLLEIGFQ